MSKYSLAYAIQETGSVDVRKFHKLETSRKTLLQKLAIILGL
jgi:hypothetical protein